MTGTYPPDFRARIVLVAVGLGLAAMLMASLAQRFLHPDLTINKFGHQVAEEAAPAMEGTSSNMAAIGQLMAATAKNPQDRNTILQLVESLMAVGQWESAENFAQKALELDREPDFNPRTLYLLAIIHHNQGRHEQAAELLEKLLEKSENPSARYSLGILYLHYLHDPEAGRAQMERGLASKDLSPGLRRAMQEELEKAGQKAGEASLPKPAPETLPVPRLD